MDLRSPHLNAMTTQEKRELEEKLWREARRTHNEVVWGNNLSNKLGVREYVNEVVMIEKLVPRGTKILDWGGGRGHITYLLHERGYAATYFDVLTPKAPTMGENVGIAPVIGTDPVKMPFEDASFDAVTSSGVLEHVQEIPPSIKEVRRVLKPGSYFFVFHFPYRYSFSEWVARTFLKSTYHPICWTPSELRRALQEGGFEVVRTGYENGIPKNLGPFPRLRPLYDKFTDLFWYIDRVLIKTPLIRSVASNAVYAIARKPQ